MIFTYVLIPGRGAQSVTTNGCLTADQGAVSLIPARYDTLVKIDHEIN